MTLSTMVQHCYLAGYSRHTRREWRDEAPHAGITHPIALVRVRAERDGLDEESAVQGNIIKVDFLLYVSSVYTRYLDIASARRLHVEQRSVFYGRHE